MKVQRTALVLANRAVIDVAEDVALDVANHKTNDLVVDPSLAGVHCPVNVSAHFLWSETDST